MNLSPCEVRVLGSLMEKEMTTPEQYPLSLHALQAAANQRSSREPVMALGEEEIRQALRGLEDLDLVAPVRDARVPKFEHRARTVLQLRRDETAILCLLLLRGAQTPGELRSRSDRLFPFEDLEAVTTTLDRLASRPALIEGASATPERTGPLTVALPRQPGSREVRYTHLLGRPGEASAGAAPPQESDAGRWEGRDSVQEELRSLRAELAELRARVDLLTGS